MDPKAAARSKRSHTVHGRRTHQTPAAAAAHKQKRAASSSSAPRSRNLPSNWDRYEAEAEAEDPAAAAEWTGEVAPRSQGADFAFLLDQARGQPRDERGLGVASRIASQASPFDFMQASTFMLEAKGGEILSWFEDDNFILEDDLAPDFEVPFLSIDLHALATRMSKLKLSQRLFIEEDLPPEDQAVASQDNQMPIQGDTSLGSDGKDSLIQQNIKDIRPVKEATLPKHSTGLSVCSDTDEDRIYTTNTDTVPVTGHSERKLNVVTTEDELDMLLNSLGGAHLSSSNFDESLRNHSTFKGMKIDESTKKVTSSKSSKTSALAPLDDALDILLSESSLSVQKDDIAASNLTSREAFNPDDNIDFRYAKQIDVTSNDDSLDDLLADTSFSLNGQKQSTPVQLEEDKTNVSVPPHSGPSDIAANFDSWFDSL